MHIGIYYTSALHQRGGVGRYTRSLVQALAHLDSHNQYTLVISRDSPIARTQWVRHLLSFANEGIEGTSANENPFTPEKPLPENFSLKILPLPERLLTILWYGLYPTLALDHWTGSFDLFHAPDFVLPPLHQSPGILTVHDLSFKMHPQGTVPKLRRRLQRVVPRSIDRAQHVLADSDNIKRDLQKYFRVAAEKITVIRAGIDDQFHPVTEIEILKTVQGTYKLPEHFILGLGTLEPRKNFTGLIEAFNILAQQDSHLHLVIVGGKGWLYEPIFQTAAQSPYTERMHFIDFIANEHLPALYSLATFFVYPSHYEGFSIPVVEAMACGTPVITADNSSLPEVAGNAALLTPATDIPALANIMHNLSQDPLLREQCIERGFQQAKQFTWTKAAQTLLRVYEQYGR